ncbi:flagellar hook-basal body complex protein [Clostridium sp.]|uniref:flagellar hook-basal body complex protein n=1 Tax=Clostridium sp. TaxID=1506 RepID=UPI001B425FF1|nr:flagellar hook-basal body complex protein [Clostridium sp.]MBP3917400.1 flagellar basal body rod protein FlgG [Clostridium sp.]
MLRAIWTSKSSMMANQNKLDIISNNITNISTTGYKKVELEFKDLYHESLDRLGVPINDKESVVGTGVKNSNIYRNTTQGSLLETGAFTDFAIDGEGFFKVISPNNQELYTRNGKFNIDMNGNLVDDNGYYLEIDYLNGYNKNNVNLGSNNFVVDTNGNLYKKMNQGTELVGKISTYSAIGTEAFLSIGESYYINNPGVEVTTADSNIYQGYLENSNVDIGEEFTDMIIAQRAFQLASKSLQTADEMWGMVNSLRT